MLILIVGLPGSGKSWYALNKMSGAIIVDDPKSPKCFPTDVNKEDTIVVAHSCLCIPVFRKNMETKLSLLYPGHEIEYIFFENEPWKCRSNVAHRSALGDVRDVEISINQLSTLYTIPASIKPLEIWRPKQ